MSELINYIECFNKTIKQLHNSLIIPFEINSNEIYTDNDYIQLKQVYSESGLLLQNELTKLHLCYSPDGDPEVLKSLLPVVLKAIRGLIAAAKTLINFKYSSSFKELFIHSAEY